MKSSLLFFFAFATKLLAAGFVFPPFEALQTYKTQGCANHRHLPHRDCSKIDQHSEEVLRSSLDTAHQPQVPQTPIPSQTLFTQAKNLLTFKDVKYIIHSHGKSSRNKAELFHTMKSQLGSERDVSNSGLNATDPKQQNISVKDGNPPKKYKQMTVKELKNELRLRGAKVSGRKVELIQRLMDIDIDQNDSETKNKNRTTEHEKWHVLMANPSENSPTSDISMIDIDVELPIFSTLLFVNKPGATSTLPTRKVEGYPSYPCLSDQVKDWLYTDPEGMVLMARARRNEELFWNYTLTTNELDSVNAKESKKKTRLYEKMKEKWSSFEPRPVHRLDIDTSGIVCIALTPYALRTAGKLFECKTLQCQNANCTVNVDKRYTAMVEGLMDDKSNVKRKGTVSYSIGKIWVQNDIETATGHHEWACDILKDESIAFCRPGDLERSNPLKFVENSLREAMTSYRVVDRIVENDIGNVTRVELMPHTGRGHQLRLHMSSIGHPIVGDSMHGEMKKDGLFDGSKLHLHASNLSMECCILTDMGIKRCRAEISSKPWF